MTPFDRTSCLYPGGAAETFTRGTACVGILATDLVDLLQSLNNDLKRVNFKPVTGLHLSRRLAGLQPLGGRVGRLCRTGRPPQPSRGYRDRGHDQPLYLGRSSKLPAPVNRSSGSMVALVALVAAGGTSCRSQKESS